MEFARASLAEDMEKIEKKTYLKKAVKKKKRIAFVEKKKSRKYYCVSFDCCLPLSAELGSKKI